MEKQVINLMTHGKTPYYHSLTNECDMVIVKGCDPDQTINVGDVVTLEKANYTVLSIERRDHKGAFKNPSDAINSFFSAQIQIINK